MAILYSSENQWIHDEIKAITDNQKKSKELVKIGEASFDYIKYIEWFKVSYKDFGSESMHDYWWNLKDFKYSNSFHTLLENSFLHMRGLQTLMKKKDFMSDKYPTLEEVINLKMDRINNFSDDSHFHKVKDYLLKYDKRWNLMYLNDIFAILQYGKIQIMLPIDLLENIHLIKDYSDIADKKELDKIENLAMMKFDKYELANYQNIKKSYDKCINDIIQTDSCQNSELAEMKKIYDEKMAEIDKYKNDMYKLQMEMEEKLLLMKQKLESQLFLLDTQIYCIQCYMGDCIDFVQIRKGSSVDLNQPIILNQKMRYLDEELLRLNALGSEFNNHNYVEDLLKTNDEVFNCFCPSIKGVSLIRNSKNNIGVSSSKGILINCDIFHGKEIAILVRDGENLYLGWCDENKIDIEDDLFVTQNTEEKITSKEGVASRVYLFSILQGLQDNSNIIRLPIKVDFTKENEFVKYSSADNFIADSTYKLLSEYIYAVNEATKINDCILITRRIDDGHYRNFGWGGSGSVVYERGTNEYINRTRDSQIEKKVYPVSYINDHGEIFVSAKKEYSSHGATARMLVNKNEFINLTYMNSILLKYYIDTKRIGSFHVDWAYIDYANFIEHLLKTFNFVKEREEKEFRIISPYMDIYKIQKWQNFLASWKLLFNVRAMTDYQAKRFVKWYHQLTDDEMEIYKDYLIINDISKFLIKSGKNE